MNENQYWINQAGVQAGPVTREQMREMSLTDQVYVWRAGMDDWVRITEMSELEGCYTITNAAPAAPQSVAVEQPTGGGGQPQAGDAPMPADAPGVTAEQPSRWQPQYAAQQPAGQYPAGQYPAGQYSASQRPAVDLPPCPPTNLVWAVIATILCCLPLGVVAIVYSVKVSQNYSLGNFAAAEHYSEVSAWWCIGSIVAGIALTPVVMLLQAALMG